MPTLTFANLKDSASYLHLVSVENWNGEIDSEPGLDLPMGEEVTVPEHQVIVAYNDCHQRYSLFITTTDGFDSYGRYSIPDVTPIDEHISAAIEECRHRLGGCSCTSESQETEQEEEATPEPKTETTYRNDRTGETLTLELNREQLAERFAEVAPGSSWLWYHMARVVQNAQPPATAAATMDTVTFIADSFMYALGMGLKRPMIRCVFNNRRYKIYLSQRGTVCFKSGAVEPGTSNPVGDEEYVGCIWQGRFLPNRDRSILPQEQDFMDRLNADPVTFLAECSRDMDRCCYCGQPLEDARSKQVGYGETCSKRWGLPWGKTYDEKVPSFADVYMRAYVEEKDDIRGMMAAVRAEPYNETLWAVLGDALQIAGMQPAQLPKVPHRGVRIPNVG